MPRVRSLVRGQRPSGGVVAPSGDRAHPRLLARAGRRIPRHAPDARWDAGRPVGSRPADARCGGGTRHSHRRGARLRRPSAGIVHGRVSPPTACCSTPPAMPTSPTSRSARPDPIQNRGRRRARPRRHGAGMPGGAIRPPLPTSWPVAWRRPVDPRWRSSCRCSSPRSREPTPPWSRRSEPVQGSAGVRRGRRRRLLRPCRSRRRDPRPARQRRPARTAACSSSAVPAPASPASCAPGCCRGYVAETSPGSRQWFVTTMLPGSSPFKELAEGLRRVAVTETTGLADELAERRDGIDRVLRRLVPDDGQLLLVIDQFEELFTLTNEQDQRGVPRRADARRLGPRQPAPGGGDPARRLLRPAARRPTIRRRRQRGNGDRRRRCRRPTSKRRSSSPSSASAGRVERALVAELVSDVADEPAALPSLQFALFELAERSSAKTLTLAAYRELGGVDGAIASRAEALYSSLDDDERAGVRQMFERLVVVGAEGEPTRRRGDSHRAVRAGVDRPDRGRHDRPMDAGAAAHPRSPSPDPGADRRARPRGAAPRVATSPRLDRRGPRRDRDARTPARGGDRLGRTRPRPRGAVPGCPARGGPRRRPRPVRCAAGTGTRVPRRQPGGARPRTA